VCSIGCASSRSIAYSRPLMSGDAILLVCLIGLGLLCLLVVLTSI
jgi:hypothetical protein